MFWVTTERGATLAGAKALADPARRVMMAADFMVLVLCWDLY